MISWKSDKFLLRTRYTEFWAGFLIRFRKYNNNFKGRFLTLHTCVLLSQKEFVWWNYLTPTTFSYFGHGNTLTKWLIHLGKLIFLSKLSPITQRYCFANLKTESKKLANGFIVTKWRATSNRIICNSPFSCRHLWLKYVQRRQQMWCKRRSWSCRLSCR
jgi:hypothetical protein